MKPFCRRRKKAGMVLSAVLSDHQLNYTLAGPVTVDCCFAAHVVAQMQQRLV